MRADRLLSILLLLQTRGRMTARDLAQRMEVSDRTIHRDMEALSGAGVPVFAERGTGGGWELMGDYRTDLTGLTDGEIQALFSANPVGLLADLGLDKAAEGALIKLLATLPAAARRDAENVRQGIHIDVNGWQQPSETVDLLPLLQTAIAQERKVELVYQRSDETVVERLVDPLGLVANRNIWYLIAAVGEETRTYRVTRMQAAHMTEQPATRPADFDLATYWAQAKVDFKAALPAYYATVRVAPDTVQRLQWGGRYARVERVGPPDAEGWQPVWIRFQSATDAAEYILSYGAQIEAIEPPDLREQVIALAASVLAFYQQKQAIPSAASR